MGVSSSTDAVNSMLSNAITITSQYENICSIPSSSAQDQINLNGCKISNSKIFIESRAIVSQSCIQNSNTTTAITSSISQNIKQAAQAITQNFGFPSLSLAQTFITESEKLADTISNNYINHCSASTNFTDSITCTNSQINNSVVEIDSFQTLTQTCIQTDQNTLNIVANLISILNQSAVSKQENAFTIFVFAFLGIIAIIAYLVIGFANNAVVQWVIVGFIFISVLSTIIYTLSARSSGHYPYTNTG